MKFINRVVAVTAAMTALSTPCAAIISPDNSAESFDNGNGVFCAAPTDMEYTNSFTYYNQIKMEDAWDITTGYPNVTVGVIDTGINYYHEDLGGRVDYESSKDFTGGNSPCSDNYASGFGHGTQVAGVIGAVGNNNNGSAGVCWGGVTMVSYKVNANAAQVASAINEAKNAGIKLLNLSMNISVTDDLKTAIQNYSGLIVCAAGNDGKDINSGNMLASLNYDNLLVVGATESSSDKIALFSNYGSINVDLFAPGEGIYTTYATGGYGTNSGTSFAAPLVTGTAALILSRYPSMSGESLKKIIMDNVDKVSDLSGKCVSGGRLNAYKAVSHEHALKYVRIDSPFGGSLVHQNKCSTCGYVASSGRHELVKVGNACYRCKVCGYMPQLLQKPGGDYNSIGGEQLSAQGADGEALCEDCAEHSHETTVIDELEELKESLVA